MLLLLLVTVSSEAAAGGRASGGGRTDRRAGWRALDVVPAGSAGDVFMLIEPSLNGRWPYMYKDELIRVLVCSIQRKKRLTQTGKGTASASILVLSAAAVAVSWAEL